MANFIAAATFLLTAALSNFKAAVNSSCYSHYRPRSSSFYIAAANLKKLKNNSIIYIESEREKRKNPLNFLEKDGRKKLKKT